MLIQDPKFGHVVYCELNGQVYMIERLQDPESEKLYLKNLTNLESPLCYVYRNQLRDFPDNWATKSYYEKMAKNIVDKRSRV